MGHANTWISPIIHHILELKRKLDNLMIALILHYNNKSQMPVANLKMCFCCQWLKHHKICKRWPSEENVGQSWSQISFSKEDPSNRKKYPLFLLMPNFRKLQDDSKNVSLKIRSRVPQKLGPFFSLFLMRKTLSSGQKWFLTIFHMLRWPFPHSWFGHEVPELKI